MALGFHERSEFGAKLENSTCSRQMSHHSGIQYWSCIVAWLISDVSLLARTNYINDLFLANPIVGRLV